MFPFQTNIVLLWFNILKTQPQIDLFYNQDYGLCDLETLLKHELSSVCNVFWR